MARIIYTLGELAGSVGGNTFQRNSAGTIVRSRPMVNRKSSIKQQAAHQAQQNLLFEWQEIGSDLRDDWNTFASAHNKTNKFGQEKTLTGQNWFTSVNYMRLLMGETLLTSPPSYDLPTDAPDFEISVTSTDIFIILGTPPDWDEMSLLVWASLPTTRQKSSINQLRKLATCVNTAASDTITITSFWEEATGMTWDPVALFPAVNIFVCLEIIRRSSGITSPMLCAQVNTSEVSPYDPDAIAYFDAVPTPFSDARKEIINNLVLQLKSDGNWDKIDRLWLLANEAADQGLTSLVNPLSDLVVVQGAPAFVTDRGYTGNGTTEYLDTKYNPTTDAVNFVLDSWSFGNYSRTNRNASDVDIGNSTPYTLIQPRTGGSLTVYPATSGGSIAAAVADSLGMFIAIRTGASAVAAYRNDTQIVTGSNSSTSLANQDFFIMGYSNSGALTTPSIRQQAFAFTASGTIDVATFYAAIQDYMTAIGANV